MTKQEAKAALTYSFFAGNDIVTVRPSVHSDTALARRFAARFGHKYIITSDGWVVVQGTA